MTGTQYCSLNSVDFADRRVRVWRSSTERFVPISIANHGRLSWYMADISMQGNRDPYVVQNGTPTTVRYIIEILDV